MKIYRVIIWLIVIRQEKDIDMWVPLEKPLSENDRHRLEVMLESQREWVMRLLIEQKSGIFVNPIALEKEQMCLDRLYKLLDGFEWAESNITHLSVI